MVNEEVLGGLRSALERGESLKKAMITLYNAGYGKEEIEECARMVVPSEEAPNAPMQEIEEAVKILSATAAPSRPVQAAQPQFQQPVQPRLMQPAQAVRQQPPQIFRQQPRAAQPQFQQPAYIQRQALPMQRQMLPMQSPIFPVQTARLRPAYTAVQAVSGYGEEITPREKAIILILVSLLVFLLASLGVIFLFKQQIINFFSTIFGQ
jgi:hypothetical protein